MTSTKNVFTQGDHHVKLFTVEDRRVSCSPLPLSSSLPPPKPLLAVTPTDEGEYPVVVVLHGYLLYNNFYSQLLQHVASHGFIVIAPQLYVVAGPDATGDINSAAATINWLPAGLPSILPAGVRADLTNLAVAGHSRGGKAAFGVALGLATTDIKISALVAIDPVDGMDKDNHTRPPILTGVPDSLDINMPVLVIGCGLSELKKNPLFPACAPKGVNHCDFFAECQSPACHFTAKDYGHLDMLDDETKGLRGRVTYCLCTSGGKREPMRRFVAGIMVAFTRAHMFGDTGDLDDVKNNPGTAPVVLSEISFR